MKWMKLSFQVTSFYLQKWQSCGHFGQVLRSLCDFKQYCKILHNHGGLGRIPHGLLSQLPSYSHFCWLLLLRLVCCGSVPKLGWLQKFVSFRCQQLMSLKFVQWIMRCFAIRSWLKQLMTIFFTYFAQCINYVFEMIF